MISRVTRGAISAATRRTPGAFKRGHPALACLEISARSLGHQTAWKEGGRGKAIDISSGDGDEQVGRGERDDYQRRFLTETTPTPEGRGGAASHASSTGFPEHDGHVGEDYGGGVVKVRQTNDDSGDNAGGFDFTRAHNNSNSSGVPDAQAPSTNYRQRSERRRNDYSRREGEEGRTGGQRSYRRNRGNGDSDSAPVKESWDSTEREYVHLIMELKASRGWARAIDTYKQASDKGGLTRVMYNATVSALARSPQWRMALSVFHEMRDAGHMPDAYTFNAVIQACGHGNEEELAFALFEEMPAAGVIPDAYTFNHLIAVCKKDKWEKALSLMRDMEQAGLRPSNVTYNAVIVACGNGSQPDQAMALLEEMRNKGVQVTEGTYSAAIAACGKALMWEQALSLLDEIKRGRDNLEPNEYCYNACISACARASRWAEALRLLREMQSSELTFRSGTYAQVVKACLNAGELAPAEELVDEMRASGIYVKRSTQAMIEKHKENRGGPRSRSDSSRAPSPWTSGILENRPAGHVRQNKQQQEQEQQATADPDETGETHLATASEITPSDAFDAPPSVPSRPRQTTREFLKRVGRNARARRWAEIGRELDEARMDPEVKVSMRMYEGCIAALASGGRWSEAIGVLENIHEAGLTPNAKCVTAAIRACARGEPPRWGMAVSLLRGLKEPDVWAYVATLAALAKARQWKTSVSLLEGMRGRGLEPNLYCYNSTLEAFLAGNPPQWQKACELLVQMKGEGIEPDLTSYTHAVEACLAASESEAAKAVMDDMVEAGHPPAEDLKSLVVRASSSP